MSKLCIIPARSGSKRIPGKNVRDFLGKPMISYSIESAINSELFDEVMVSTDDERIAEIAKSFGANVPFLRSEATSGDFAIINDVLDEVLESYKLRNQHFDYVCIIFATAPLVKSDNLKVGFELMIEKNYDSVRPIVQFSYPIQRAFKIEDDVLKMKNPEYYKVRSQDLDPSYHDAGQFYWINSNKTLLDKKKGGIVISELDAQDIDTVEDWMLAEMKYKISNKSQ